MGRVGIADFNIGRGSGGDNRRVIHEGLASVSWREVGSEVGEVDLEISKLPRDADVSFLVGCVDACTASEFAEGVDKTVMASLVVTGERTVEEVNAAGIDKIGESAPRFAETQGPGAWKREQV